MSETLQSTRDEIQDQIVLGYRIFAALGWGELGDGHISGRDPEDPDTFWLLDANIPFKHADRDNLVRLDANGTVVEGDGETNWPAFYIHYPILHSRPDIRSVAHTHTPYGTPFAAGGRRFHPITQESCVFIDDHAVFDDEEVQVQDVECGFRIAKALASNRGLVLRNHGLLTVGNTVKASVVWFVMMEKVAEAHLKARSASPISHNAALYAKEDLVSDSQVEHGFKNLVAHYLD